MTKSYKKRAKAGYESDKKKSNRSERVYEKSEISKELEKLEQGDEFREKGGKKKKRTKRQKLEKKLTSDEKYYRMLKDSKNGWVKDFAESLRQSIEKTKEKLKELDNE